MSGARGPRFSQQGAALLMATVFLLVVIALFGLISLRMAASDITDTSLQNDSVAALFLAESGVERALQRLGTGTTCDALTPDAEQTLGRGTFQIGSAAVNGGLCRIQVLGRVVLNGTTRAQRRIEADLQATAGNGNTWAVGSNGTIRRWDGSSWSASASNVTATLNDVSCASANSCWAVGSGGTVLHWTGSWSSSANGIPAGTTLNSVACVPNSADDCIAVGVLWGLFGVVYQYGAGSWTLLDMQWFTPYTDAHCTATECYAVGLGGLMARRGGGWTLEDSNTGQNLHGVACTSATDCWAVGARQGNSFFYDQRAGGTWTPQPVSDPGDRRDLYDVACPADDDCWAVGERQAGNVYTVTHWDGSNWTADFVNRTGADNLNAVACAGANDCWAVGGNGDALRWTGAAWAFSNTGTAQNLNGVYSSPGGGSPSLQRWREIVQ